MVRLTKNDSVFSTPVKIKQLKLSILYHIAGLISFVYFYIAWSVDYVQGERLYTP